MEAIYAAGGTLLWIVAGLIGVVLLCWIAVMLIGSAVQALRNGKPKPNEGETRKEGGEQTQNAPVYVARKTDTHSGHSSGHDHHEKKSSGWLSAIMWILFVVILVAALRFFIIPTLQGWGFGQIPGTSSERRYELSQTHGASMGSASVAVTLGKQYVTAPPNTRDWSESDWMDVPDGYNVRAYPSMNLGEYEVQCRDHAGNAHPWSLATCGELDMVRFRSTDGKPFAVSYEFLPK